MPRQQESVLIVERVASGSLGEKATLQRGDRLLSYDEQVLSSPAALLALEENTFGKESVLLVLQREGQHLGIVVPPGKLDIDTRPELDADLLTGYETGHAAFEAGQFVEAARQWSDVAEQAGDPSVGAWLYGKAGEAWQKASDWQQALEAHLAAWNRLLKGEDTSARVKVLIAQGRCHQRLSDHETATNYFKQALQIEEISGRQVGALRVLNNLGSVAVDWGSLDAATNYATRAAEIATHLVPESLDLAASLNTLGIVAWYRGELSSTHTCFNHALAIRERVSPGSLDVAASLNNLGLVAWQRGDLAVAQDYYTTSLNIKEKLGSDSRDIAQNLDNLGIVVRERGDLSAAHMYHTRALNIQNALSPDSLDVAVCLNNLGIVTMERGDLAMAQKHYAQALALFERFCPGSLQVAGGLSNLGNIAQQMGNLDEAQTYHSRAVKLQARLGPGSIYYSEMLEQLGRTFASMHRFGEALFVLQQSVEIVEQQRSQISSPDARALLLAQHTGKYAGLIQCHLALQQPQEAYSVLERARARSLNELLAERRLDLTADAPPELLRQQQDLDQQRSAVYNQLAQSAATAEQEEAIQDLHRQLRDLERQQQDLTAAIRQASPHYASLQYPQPLNCQQAQAALDPGSLLLSYLVDKEQTFLFAVTSTNVEAYSLSIGRDGLQEQVRAFRRSLDVRRLEYDPTEAISQGDQLYQQLLAPAQAHIRKAKRLLLCPDGPLYSLPFAALVTKPGRKPRYLGTEKPLHSVVSMTVYAQARQPRPQSQTEREHIQTEKALVKAAGSAVQIIASARRLLALGDPLYASVRLGHTSAFARSGEMADRVSEGIPAEVEEAIVLDAELSEMQTRGLSLLPLPHTRTEVENLAALFGDRASVKMGADATKTAALEGSGEADILHFACHGWLDAQMPLSSGLLLSQPEALGEQAIAGDNGMLQAWEIMQQMRLKADLVVLSACQTGLGQEIRGEGLIGLTRAFQYAGARSLVVSLWEVNDASTSYFMQAFYTALRDGRSKDEALQAGVKALQADACWNHPYYWSAFVLVGDCR